MRWIGWVLAILALTLTVSAQVKDKRVEMSPYIGGIFYDGDLNLKDTLLFGFRVGYNINQRFGLEAAPTSRSRVWMTRACTLSKR